MVVFELIFKINKFKFNEKNFQKNSFFINLYTKKNVKDINAHQEINENKVMMTRSGI